ncbi:hypothetical protein [Parasitella parasitica]|uniref:Uncharacterized protein n=1 Tax=Parasitella parasitica TaxID=35722 RepID=A0A0B7MZJ8_9FUNG|nr:hypothetical protein [Parasitella parasitica]
MTESNGWSTLPTEILLDIFAHIKDTFGWREARHSIKECQIVCRGWSFTAQHVLYTNVYLPKKNIASFVTTLIDTSSTTALGDLVRSIEFYSGEAKASGIISGLNNYIVETLRHIPNVETIGSSAKSNVETGFLWRRIMESEIQNLGLFSLSDEWECNDKALYTSLALKHKGSLKKLRLLFCMDSETEGFVVDNDSLRLKDHINEFKSLKQLQFDGYYYEASLLTELIETVNDCPETVCLLRIKECDLTDSHESNVTKIKQNTSIQDLQIVDSKLPASTIEYFASNLTGLKSLKFISDIENPCESNTEQEYAEWWKQMANLCQGSRHYDININNVTFDDFVHHITGCLQLIRTIENSRKGSTNGFNPSLLTPTEFAMYMSHPPETMDCYNVSINHKGSRIRLIKSYSTESLLRRIDFSTISACLLPFSPSIVNVLHIEPMLVLYNLHQTTSVFSALIDGQDPRSAQRCWSIFESVTSLTKNKPGSVGHLDKAIFPGILLPLREDTEQDGQMKISGEARYFELKFSDSIFHPIAFSEMSLKLPNIETLILDGCTFLSDSPSKLEIDLSTTNLGQLVLNKIHILHSGNLFYPADDCKIILINNEGREEIVNVTACDDSPCISIKFKELQSLVISGTQVFNKRKL